MRIHNYACFAERRLSCQVHFILVARHRSNSANHAHQRDCTLCFSVSLACFDHALGIAPRDRSLCGVIREGKQPRNDRNQDARGGHARPRGLQPGPNRANDAPDRANQGGEKVAAAENDIEEDHYQRANQRSANGGQATATTVEMAHNAFVDMGGLVADGRGAADMLKHNLLARQANTVAAVVGYALAYPKCASAPDRQSRRIPCA